MTHTSFTDCTNIDAQSLSEPGRISILKTRTSLLSDITISQPLTVSRVINSTSLLKERRETRADPGERHVHFPKQMSEMITGNIPSSLVAASGTRHSRGIEPHTKQILWFSKQELNHFRERARVEAELIHNGASSIECRGLESRINPVTTCHNRSCISEAVMRHQSFHAYYCTNKVLPEAYRDKMAEISSNHIRSYLETHTQETRNQAIKRAALDRDFVEFEETPNENCLVFCLKSLTAWI